MPEDTPGTPVTFLSEIFRKALNDALSQAVASPCTVTLVDGETSASEGSFLYYALTASGPLRGNATFQMAISEALSLAQKLLSEPPDSAAELTVARKQAIQDLLAKAAKLVETRLEPQVGASSFKIDPIEAAPSGGTHITLGITESDGKSVSVKLQFDPELLAAVGDAFRPAQEVAHAVPEPATAPNPGAGNLDLLLGVDLNVTLRFGQRTLTLREIMELSSGSIIELDRQVQEPADLLLGDKLIARGEVVVVDGNYGLRITEVADPTPGNEKLGLHSAL